MNFESRNALTTISAEIQNWWFFFFFKASSYLDYWEGSPTFPYLSDYPCSSLYGLLLFFPLKLKITSNSYRSHKIKRLLLLGRKAVTNIDSILKSRDTDVEKRFADTVREGEAVMNWEIRTDMHPPPCVKQIARGPLPYHAGSSAQ